MAINDNAFLSENALRLQCICKSSLFFSSPVQLIDGAAAGKLLAKQPELKANFSRAQGAGSNAKANKVARFLPNPEANWGPRPKHGRAVKVCQSSTPDSSHSFNRAMNDTRRPSHCCIPIWCHTVGFRLHVQESLEGMT